MATPNPLAPVKGAGTTFGFIRVTTTLFITLSVTRGGLDWQKLKNCNRARLPQNRTMTAI